MKILSATSTAIFLLTLNGGSLAFADTDATAFLNAALAKKPAVAHHRTVITSKEKCIRHHLPPAADGGDSYDCFNVDVPVVQNYAD